MSKGQQYLQQGDDEQDNCDKILKTDFERIEEGLIDLKKKKDQNIRRKKQIEFQKSLQRDEPYLNLFEEELNLKDGDAHEIYHMKFKNHKDKYEALKLQVSRQLDETAGDEFMQDTKDNNPQTDLKQMDNKGLMDRGDWLIQNMEERINNMYPQLNEAKNIMMEVNIELDRQKEVIF